MAQRNALPGEINGDAIDRYTIGHAAFGLMMGLGRIPWWGALGVAVGWELLERVLKDAVPRAFPNSTQDSLANASCDALAMMAGWGAIQLLPAPPAPLAGSVSDLRPRRRRFRR